MVHALGVSIILISCAHFNLHELNLSRFRNGRALCMDRRWAPEWQPQASFGEEHYYGR